MPMAFKAFIRGFQELLRLIFKVSLIFFFTEDKTDTRGQHIGICDRTPFQNTVFTYLVVPMEKGHGRPHGGDNV